MMDRCFTNSAALNKTNELATATGEHEWLLSYCMSHLACNAGDEAGFPLLNKLWSLLQKVFAHSTNAKDIFFEVSGMRWLTYSETRWFSKYDVFELLMKIFSDLLTVMTRIVTVKTSQANSATLLNLLLDPARSNQLKIELAAYVDGIFELRNLCYYLEADWTDLAFKCSARIDDFVDMFPNGEMKPLKSADRLIMHVSPYYACLL